MNQDQKLSLLRTLAIFAGGILVSKGVISSSENSAFVTALVTLVGAVFTVGPAILGVLSKTYEAMAASMAKTKAGQNAMVTVINASDNGAKVVANTPATATVPAINSVPKLGPGRAS